MKIHIVQKGDTLWEIAKKYGVDFEQLKKINSHIATPDMIMPGMKIKIPSTMKQVKKTAEQKETMKMKPKEQPSPPMEQKTLPIITEDDHKKKPEVKMEMPKDQLPLYPVEPIMELPSIEGQMLQFPEMPSFSMPAEQKAEKKVEQKKEVKEMKEMKKAKEMQVESVSELKEQPIQKVEKESKYIAPMMPKETMQEEMAVMPTVHYYPCHPMPCYCHMIHPCCSYRHMNHHFQHMYVPPEAYPMGHVYMNDLNYEYPNHSPAPIMGVENYERDSKIKEKGETKSSQHDENSHPQKHFHPTVDTYPYML